MHVNCSGSGSPPVMVVGAGFSVDWALVQIDVAKFTSICTYDPSGTAWSDPGPAFASRQRVDEIHRMVRAAGSSTPMILVGLSIGGCIARLYAATYPADVSGMVIVDHAFSPMREKPAAGSPVVVERTPIEISTEDASQFNHLPKGAQELHRWAASLHPKLPSWEDAEECLSQLKAGSFPLGNLPLAVVSTGNQAKGYRELQDELLALSHNSIHLYATRSFHAVEIDQPDVVVSAIREVVQMVRRPTPR